MAVALEGIDKARAEYLPKKQSAMEQRIQKLLNPAGYRKPCDSKCLGSHGLEAEMRSTRQGINMMALMQSQRAR
jgi:hypothetical protein